MKKLVIPKGVTVFVTGKVNTTNITLGDDKSDVFAYTKPSTTHVLIEADELNVEHILCQGILYCGDEVTTGISDLEETSIKKLLVPKDVTIYVDGKIVIENDISSNLGVPKVMAIAERPEHQYVFIGSDNLKVDDIICDGELLAKGEIFLEAWRDK